MTEIYMLNTAPLNEPEVFLRKLGGLSGFRQNKALSFKNKSDRVLSLGAGMLISRGLRRLGLDEKNMKYSIGRYGKPYLEDYPEINFSVSHCSDMAVCAFSEFSVGCDVEIIRTPDYKVAKKFFQDREESYVLRHEDESERAKAFFGIWTFKESFVKATGRGLSMPFKEFSVVSEKHKELRLNYSFGANEYYFKQYAFGDYIAACCCEEPEFPDVPEICGID